MPTKLVALLQKIQIVAGGIFLGIFLATVLVQIFSRYIGVAVTWTEDVSQYAFIWAVFMGASAMVYERKHFAFTSVSDTIKSPKTKTCIAVIVSALILAFSVPLFLYGIVITRQFWNYRWVTISAFRRGPVWLCLPIAGAAISIYCVYHIVNDIITYKKGGA